MSYPAFLIVLGLCLLIGLTIIVFLLVFVPRLLIKKLGKIGGILSIVEIVLVVFLVATGVKWFLNGLHIHREGISPSVEQSKSDSLFIKEYFPDPEFISIEEEKVKISEAWVEHRFTYQYPLVWFTEIKKEKGYKLVYKLESYERFHFWLNFEFPEGSRSGHSIPGMLLHSWKYDEIPKDEIVLKYKTRQPEKTGSGSIKFKRSNKAAVETRLDVK